MLIETMVEKAKEEEKKEQQRRDDYYYLKGYSEALKEVIKLILSKNETG
jgi:hypothetical protein